MSTQTSLQVVHFGSRKNQISVAVAVNDLHGFSKTSLGLQTLSVQLHFMSDMCVFLLNHREQFAAKKAFKRLPSLYCPAHHHSAHSNQPLQSLIAWLGSSSNNHATFPRYSASALCSGSCIGKTAVSWAALIPSYCRCGRSNSWMSSSWPGNKACVGI